MHSDKPEFDLVPVLIIIACIFFPIASYLVLEAKENLPSRFLLLGIIVSISFVMGWRTGIKRKKYQ